MKRAITATLLAVFGLSILGCHASIDSNDPNDSHYKKTTTYNKDGTTETKTTETKTNTNP